MTIREREETVDQQSLHDCSWQELGEDPSGLGALAGEQPANSNVDWEERRAKLARTIETEVIPRLMITAQNRPTRPSLSAIVGGGPSSEDVEAFADIILSSNLNAAADFIDGMRGRGLSVEMICVDLMAPTARRLGDYWTADRCSFVDVTMGLGRLQRLLHSLSPSTPQISRRSPVRRALLMPAAGEQHTFGLLIVAEFFLRAGWDVWGGPLSTKSDPIAMVRDDWFDVVGLSIGNDKSLKGAKKQIADLRAASLNPNLAILVGGAVLLENPDLTKEIGADATTADGRDAPQLAERLVARLSAQA
jgi:methanogenic corrinoid protein MtbC1